MKRFFLLTRLNGLIAAVIMFVLTAASGQPAVAVGNIFEPFLDGEPPEIIEIVEKTVVDGGVEVTRLRFLNRELPGGEKVIIYGILAKPAGEGPYPGILVFHGGGGYAEQQYEAVLSWAGRGYAAFCVDLPGIYNRDRARSSGPWAELGWAEWICEPDASYTRLYDGVAAGLNSLNLLGSFPEVDKERIGVTGGSWGGYMTTIVSGLAGERVRAAFSVYGAGFFDEGTYWTPRIEGLPKESSRKWLESLDAGRYADGIKADYFIAAAANDEFFWPSSVKATFQKIDAPKNILFSPNDSHKISVPGGTHGPPRFNTRAHRTHMERLWMDYHLKGTGGAFPECSAYGAPERKGMSAQVRFRVEGSAHIRSAGVWHSYGETPWRARFWTEAETEDAGEGYYTALIPVEETGYPVDWFALATDVRNRTVSTPMQRIYPDDLGFSPEERGHVIFDDDFESEYSKVRWRRPHFYRGSGESEISMSAGRAGGSGLVIKGHHYIQRYGMRGAPLAESGAKGFLLWVKSPGGTGFDVELIAEMPDGERPSWKSSQENPGAEWRRIEIPFEDFSFEGGSPPADMLSEHLGYLMLSTPENAHLIVDRVSLF